MSEQHEVEERRDRRGVWLALGGTGALLAALYLAGWLFLGGKVPSGTQVASIDIGGLSADEAEKRLESELEERADEPIRVTWEDQTFEIDPEQAGLRLDIDATVADAGAGRTWNPMRMLEILFGSDDVEPVVEVDEAALNDALATIAEQVDVEPVDPMVTFNRRGGRDVTQPKSGQAVDRPAAKDAIVDAYLRSDGQVELTTEDVEPAVDADGLATALDEIAEPAVSGPVRLQLPNRQVNLTVRDFAPALSLEVAQGELAPKFDTEHLARRLEKLSKRIGSEAKDAKVVLRDGEPTVVPAKPGVTLDPDDVASAVSPVLSETGESRTAGVGTSVGKADFTTKDARDLKIREVVSEFTTYYPHADYRNVNLGRAAELINETVLKPGDTFSLNETVGERTEENGFTVGTIISNGVFVEDYGGGVSQVATTTFNAAFFAGLKDIEHKPHSFYIDRYPVGREATVAWPTVDLRFENTTSYGVLIEAWIVPSTYDSQGEMHVRMWSTKHWDIEAGASERYNYRSPGTQYNASDNCIEQTGTSGFDIDVYRFFRRHGEDELHHKETMNATYNAADTVICGPPPNQDNDDGNGNGNGNGNNGGNNRDGGGGD